MLICTLHTLYNVRCISKVAHVFPSTGVSSEIRNEVSIGVALMTSWITGVRGSRTTRNLNSRLSRMNPLEMQSYHYPPNRPRHRESHNDPSNEQTQNRYQHLSRVQDRSSEDLSCVAVSHERAWPAASVSTGTVLADATYSNAVPLVFFHHSAVQDVVSCFVLMAVDMFDLGYSRYSPLTMEQRS